MRSIFAAVVTAALGGCGMADWVSGNVPPPPTTIIAPAPIKPRVADECWTNGDPKPPAWIERDDTVDVRRSDEKRREAANKSNQAAFSRAILQRRRVCSAGLKVLVR